jgi:hypothetical protein
MITSNKNKFIVFIICALLLVNIVFTSILWFKNTQKHENDIDAPRPDKPNRLSEKLGFDSLQQIKYNANKMAHEAKMDELKEKEHLAKTALFVLLKSDTASNATIASFARKAADCSFEIDTTTYFYFKRLKAICNPEQLKTLEDIFDHSRFANPPEVNRRNMQVDGNDSADSNKSSNRFNQNGNHPNVDEFPKGHRPPPPPRDGVEGEQNPGTEFFDGPPPPPHDGKRPSGPPPHQRGDRRRPPPPPHDRPFDEP